MASKQKYKTSFGFIDLLFNLLVGFTFMFILAFMLINPIAKKHNFDPKAEYMVVMSWDPQSQIDIDMWVQDNLNNIVSFRTKNIALMHLDRDDLGARNDTLVSEKGEIIKIEINREVLTIRSRDPRTYTVTTHWYSKVIGRDTRPEQVTLELIRLNPYKEASIKQVILDGPGDEKHAFTFTVLSDGELELDYTEKLIVNDADNISKIK
jgi:hypothetical protein